MILRDSLFLYSGAGNIFILADNRERNFSETEILPLCEEYRADGVILLEESDRADFAMIIFNRNGSRAEACGNGTRCFALFLGDLGLMERRAHIQTDAGLVGIEITEEGVTVQMVPPQILQWGMNLEVNGSTIHADLVDVGVPHAVIFCDNLETLDVEGLGKAIHDHPAFQPRGTNVDFVFQANNQLLHVRTYERGVERETQACGTGGVASVLAACRKYDLKPPLSISVRSKEILTVDFEGPPDNPTNLTLKGPAVRLFANKG